MKSTDTTATAAAQKQKRTEQMHNSSEFEASYSCNSFSISFYAFTKLCYLSSNTLKQLSKILTPARENCVRGAAVLLINKSN